MNVSNNGFTSIEQITGQYLNSSVSTTRTGNHEISFQEALQKAVDEKQEVIFSKHANERLAQRNIELTKEQLARLNDGVKKASDKGISDSLVLLDNLAFIVNTKNNTVITAMSSDMQEENVYTNIDGAVVM